MTRPAKPAPLAPIDVQVPEWPVFERARGCFAVVSDVAGRAATLAGACAAAGGLFTSNLTGYSLIADAVCTLGGLWTLRLWRQDGQQKTVATVLYLMPGVSLAGLLLGEYVIPGISPVEAGGLLLWIVGTWVARPAETARRMLWPALTQAAAVSSAELATVEDEAGIVSQDPVAQWWAAKAAIEDGVASGTALDDIQRTGERSMRAIIRSTIPGKPVPSISVRDLSALTDIPEDEIAIDPVPGRGAGVRLLTMGKPDPGKDDLKKVWEKTIAPKAMPGTRLVGVRVGKPAVAKQATEKSDS
ncbi:hypothetical protein [Nonomuraea guangzhouensis]|uniref:DUF2637 domain-containing protein n=1 Tax=Nonomuraea guangzhouensis TaxID=1291555 RepID=A0ABW4H089_9ACTN|nr:hypothetical protein [Nonomuraea guangzhouensis]